jgi:hypothetical protein
MMGYLVPNSSVILVFIRFLLEVYNKPAVGLNKIISIIYKSKSVSNKIAPRRPIRSLLVGDEAVLTGKVGDEDWSRVQGAYRRRVPPDGHGKTRSNTNQAV